MLILAISGPMGKEKRGKWSERDGEESVILCGVCVREPARHELHFNH